MSPHDSASSTRDDGGHETTAIELIVAWTLVGLPLAWGVWQVFQKSLDLFR
jgi:hypothetical protein